MVDTTSPERPGEQLVDRGLRIAAIESGGQRKIELAHASVPSPVLQQRRKHPFTRRSAHSVIVGTVLFSGTNMIRHFSFDDIDALADVHPKLTMPTLLTYGEDDGFFPVEKARAMADQFGGPADFVTIAKCKLFLHYSR